MTILEWAQLEKNTDLFHLEHTVEMQVSIVSTRSSAIAEWPRDALRQLKPCQLLNDCTVWKIKFKRLAIGVSPWRSLKLIGIDSISWSIYHFLLVNYITAHFLPSLVGYRLCSVLAEPAHHCDITMIRDYLTTTTKGWLRGSVVFGRPTFSVLRSTCSWRVTTYVGKPSAMGQPTRPTQPFISSGSIDK